MSPHTCSLLLIVFSLSFCHCQYPCSIEALITSIKLPDTNVRPVQNWTTSSLVIIDMILYSVVKLDTSSQTLTTLLWFTMIWPNELVSWDPDKFCSIQTIYIGADKLWIPDLYIYEQIEADQSPVVPYLNIQYNGTITNSKPLRIVSFCQLDIYRFPFDVQACNISFGPYVHPITDIEMIPRSDSIAVANKSRNFFKNTGEWTLEDITVHATRITTDDIDYSVVQYRITLRREPDIYVITFIIPAFLMIMLDISSMFISMEAGERLGFKITIVLGFSVLLLILSNVLPTSNSSPFLGIFCLVCMSAMVFSILGCITISHLLMMSESQASVPTWVKMWILTYLGKIFCFRSFAKYGIDMGLSNSNLETYSNDSTVQINMPMKSSPKSRPEDGLEVKLQKKLLFQIYKIREDLLDFKNKQDVKTEWHAVALVVDRFVTVVYVIVVIVLIVSVPIVWSTR